MKISLVSDSHAEFYRSQLNWLPPLPQGADVLVLAGDNHVGTGLVQFVENVSRALPHTQIVFIAGNHEFYRQHRLATLNAYRHAFALNKKIHFLENDFIDIDGVRFVGATLWTNFPVHLQTFTQQAVMAYANDTVSDFSLISDDTTTKQVFTPEMAKSLFEDSKSTIAAILAKADPAKCVVVTHFPPTTSLLHPKFPPDKISSYFTADCLDLIEHYQPAFWLYGHNHWSAQTTIGRTVLASNQYGYPGEHSKMGGKYDPDFFVTL